MKILNFELKAITLSFLIFSLFALLPNKLKGFPVIFLLVTSLVIYIKIKKRKYPVRGVILQTLPFTILLLSVIYSENLDKIDQLLSTRLSLLVIPIAFGFIKSTKISSKLNRTFIDVFSISISVTAVLYSLLILIYLFILGVFNNDMKIQVAISYLNNEMWLLNQHPIYSSIFLSVSILIIFFNWLKLSKKTILITLPLLAIQFLTIIILNRKSVIIALCLALIFIIYSLIKKTNLQLNVSNLFLIVITIISIAVVFSSNRFKELYKKENYSKELYLNSTSMRYHIYNCSLKVIKNSPFIGYGLGDVQIELNKCYEKKSILLSSKNYNSHNQYLSYLLSSGIFGLISLVLFLFYFFRKSFLDGNTLLFVFLIFFSVIMFFENILEKQSGVIIFSFLISFLNELNFNKKLDL